MRQRLCIRCKEAPDGAGGTYLCEECLVTYRKETAKQCSKCGYSYPYTSEFFYRRGYLKGGQIRLHSICIRCFKEDSQEDYTNYKKQRLLVSKMWHDRNKERLKEQGLMRKVRVFTHYSEGPPKCSCCGESQIYFLELDHIEGNGNKHRKSINIVGGTAFYRWLINNNFPEGFQVMCANCHSAKTLLGYCPHTLENSSL